MVTRSRKWKDEQYNGQNKKRQKDAQWSTKQYTIICIIFFLFCSCDIYRISNI